MKILSLISQKGGVGKSTLVINLSVIASAAMKTLILDTDPQKSAVSWYQNREENSPETAFVEYQHLDGAIVQAKDLDYEFIVIDTAGSDSNLNSKVASVSDYCLIPCQPTKMDMEAQFETVDLIKRASKDAAFVLTRCPPVGKEMQATAAGLSNFGLPVAPTYVSNLKDYQRAIANGEGVTEYDPSGSAAHEISALFDWIQKRMSREVFSYAKEG